ncbi:MAG: penicillin-binding protein 2 [Deltaproteobacteria bacterium]|nr:penicillin-binding protein 2 [Deltaproteobacteria bacterium]TLN05209.1 MAG: penicillin-binding protein 2 [bacterium]
MKGQRIIREMRDPSRRLLLLTIGVSVLFFMLLMRLWYLQIVKAEDFQNLSENNRLRLVPVASSRGTILDRNGVILVDNSPSFSIAVIPQEVTDKEVLVKNLSRLMGMSEGELLEKWNKARKGSRYQPIILASNITRDQMEILEENRLFLPGLDVVMHPIRAYYYGVLGAHLFGHLGEISEQEIGNERFKDYNPGDYVGKSGIERNWEKELHGADGGRQIEVDARGRFLRTVSERSPTTGNSLVLTIDLAVQKAAEAAFGEQAGAAVALEVNSGEVLAFVSNPSFDPALFAGRLPAEIWNTYLNDKRHPLENKALKGQYPPGSTFKIITALAGLEEGLVDENTSVTCNGSYRFGNRSFGCWQRKGHGTVSLRKALRESCDVYFYRLGEQLGVDKIAFYAKQFGLGEPVGIGLENEKSGLIPTKAWKEKRYGKKWLSGETLSVAIGQGYVLTTPLQLAVMTAEVATEGTVYAPHLVKKVVSPEGTVLREFYPTVVRRAAFKGESWRAVKRGLFAVVNEPGGTGAVARLYEVKVAGKTGTSQVVKLRDRKGAIPYQYRDHALFVAFAPYEKPEIAVAVVVEHGEHGGSAAAPIAGKILRTYFETKGVIKKPVPQKHYSSAAVPDGTPIAETVEPVPEEQNGND